jgi:diphthamide biosynthesis protein 2
MDASYGEMTAKRDNDASDSSYTATDASALSLPTLETEKEQRAQSREILPVDTTDIVSARSSPDHNNNNNNDAASSHKSYGATNEKGNHDCDDAAQLERLASVATTTDFPEGGVEGWLVVFGSFCAMLSLFGLINSAAVFESYFSTHQLVDKTASEIGWIFSLYLFIVFFVGIQVGPIFDRFGARVLVATGSVLIFLSLLLLSWCEGMFPWPL